MHFGAYNTCSLAHIGGAGLCMKATDLLRALSDETRLRIVSLLAKYRHISVSQLVEVLETPQWRVSRHLQRLRQLGIVHAHSSGTWRYYSIRDEVREVVGGILAAVREKVQGSVLNRDLERFRELLRQERKAGSLRGGDLPR